MSRTIAKAIRSHVNALNKLVEGAKIEDVALALQDIAESFKHAEGRDAHRYKTDHDILWLSVKRAGRCVELDEFQRVAGDDILLEKAR